MLRIISSADQKALAKLLHARRMRLEKAEAIARRILDDVRRHGDRALIRYSRELDGVDLRRTGFLVDRDEIRRAWDQAPRDLVKALRLAADNIRGVAQRQLPSPWLAANGSGVRVGQLIRP